MQSYMGRAAHLSKGTNDLEQKVLLRMFSKQSPIGEKLSKPKVKAIIKAHEQ